MITLFYQFFTQLSILLASYGFDDIYLFLIDGDGIILLPYGMFYTILYFGFWFYIFKLFKLLIVSLFKLISKKLVRSFKNEK